MSEDIVVQLRGWSEGSSDDSRRMVWLMRQSADTIEALRGEVDLIKTLGVGAALETVAQKERAQKAEAEAARLKGALEAMAGEVERLKEERDAAITDRFDAAADRITAVAAERDRLKAALQPFAAIKADDGDTFDTWQDDVIIRCEVTVRDLKQARAALAGIAPQQVTLVMTVGENETTYVFSSFWAAQAWVAKHPQPHIITTRVVDHPEIVTEPMQ